MAGAALALAGWTTWSRATAERDHRIAELEESLAREKKRFDNAAQSYEAIFALVSGMPAMPTATKQATEATTKATTEASPND